MTQTFDPSQCPILDDQTVISSLSSSLIRAYRKYRRDRDECANCAADGDCPVQSQVETLINQAATEVRDEWDLIHNQYGPQ